MSLVEALLRLDREAVEAAQALRLAPLTALMALLSAAWVKGCVFAAAAGLADALRRRPPLSAVAVGAAFLLASGASTLLKALVDRERPSLADPDILALVPVPGDAAFPSGHAATAVAAAAVAGALHPRLRAPLLALAALIALSRVYLGVHHPLDILAGAALGALVAALVLATRRALLRRQPPRRPRRRPTLAAHPRTSPMTPARAAVPAAPAASGTLSAPDPRRPSSCAMPFIAGPPGPSSGGRP